MTTWKQNNRRGAAITLPSVFQQWLRVGGVGGVGVGVDLQVGAEG